MWRCSNCNAINTAEVCTLCGARKETAALVKEKTETSGMSNDAYVSTSVPQYAPMRTTTSATVSGTTYAPTPSARPMPSPTLTPDFVARTGKVAEKASGPAAASGYDDEKPLSEIISIFESNDEKSSRKRLNKWCLSGVLLFFASIAFGFIFVVLCCGAMLELKTLTVVDTAKMVFCVSTFHELLLATIISSAVGISRHDKQKMRGRFLGFIGLVGAIAVNICAICAGIFWL